MEATRFHWADYLVFGCSLAISSAVGIFFGCTGKKQSTAEEFLMAGRNMHVIPVSVSMFVSWLSAISFLGDPVEVYYYGAQYWMIVVGYALAAPPVAHICAPLYHRMKLVSVYEYLHKRYNHAMRLLASILNMVTLIIYLSVVLYAPALALSQVTGLKVWISIVIIGTVCTFYSTLGGMKAVLWADTIQMLIMLAGLLALVIQGTIRVGGLARVWQIADRGGRMNYNNFNPSPLVRNTFWTYLIGGFFRVFNPYVSSQIIVQRFCTVSSIRKAQISLYLNVPLYLIFGSLFALTGLVMFAFYHDCDPLAAGRITKSDQMVPLLVLDLLGHMPGIPGIFLACVFSASLSTLSSGQNCIAAQVLEDFVNPLWRRFSKKQLSDSRAALIAKLAGVACGAVCVGLSFLILTLGGSIFQITITLTGVIMGPVAGIFLVALLLSFVNALSAFLAFCISAAVCIWFVLGAVFVPHKAPVLPVDTSSCNLLNMTFGNYTFTTTDSSLGNVSTQIPPITMMDTDGFHVSDLYRWSPMMFAPLGLALVVLFGAIFGGISVLFKKCCRTSSDSYQIKSIQEKELGDGVDNSSFKLTEKPPISVISFDSNY